MTDEPDPPRKHYGFKEREFKRDNPSAADLPPAPTAKDLAMMSGPVVRSGAAASGAKADDPNDVYAAMQINRAAEQQSGGDEIEIRKIQSRRRRDFWLIFIPIELFFVFLAVTGHNNPLQFVCAIAGAVIIGVTLPWIMFQLMGKY